MRYLAAGLAGVACGVILVGTLNAWHVRKVLTR